MKKINIDNTKYTVDSTNRFQKQLRNAYKQGRNITKLNYVVKRLANGDLLEPKYKNHKLVNDKYYKDCYECHIEPDWLLIYQIIDDEYILLLFATGSHSNLFNK